MFKRLLSIVVAMSMALTMFGTSVVNAETIQHGNIQAEIFVSPTGNDTNPGTYEQPLATLDGARKVVANINSDMTGDIYVFFAAGDYYITNTVEFGVADSGTNGYNIIYREMDGLDTVHFIGGERVNPDSWTLVDGTTNPTTNPDGDLPDNISGQVYKTFVGTGDYPSHDFNTLYVNDARQIMARSPNLNKRPNFPSSFSDYYVTTGGGAGGSNVTSMTFNDTILDANTRNGMKSAIARGDFDAQVFTDDYGGDRHWESNTLMLSGYTAGQFTFKTDPAKPEFNRPRYTVGDQSHFFVQGNLGFLDQPGEFYHNKKTGYLYYYPTGDITQLDVIVPRVETIALFKGNDKDHTVQHIQFNGIKLEDTNFPDWYSPYWNWGDTGTGMGKYPPEAMNSTNPSYSESTDRPQFQVGVIKLNYASFITIERSHIKNAGMNGISLYLANHDIIIRDCLIEHTGHDGVQIEGGYPGDPVNGGINGEGYSRDNLIENTIIHDVGELVLCSAGISMNDAGRNTVKHVEIYNSPRRGLLLQAGYTRNPNNVGGFGDKFLNRYRDFYIHDNRFEYVYVHDCQQDGGDDGTLFVGWTYVGKDPDPDYKSNYFEQMIIDQTASNPTMTNFTPNNINTDMGANGLSFKNFMSTNSQNFNFEGGSFFQAGYGDYALFADNTNLNYGPAYDKDATFDPSKMEFDKIGVTAAYPAEYKTPFVAANKPTDIYFEDSFENKAIDSTKWSYKNSLPKTTSLYMAGTPFQGSRSLMIDDSGTGKPVLYKDFPQALNKVVSVKVFDPFAVNPTGYDSGRPFNMKNFYTMARADDGVTSRGIGINANSGAANFNNYVVNIGGVEQATSVKRSNGWHELKWDYTESGVKMYIDGVKVYEDASAPLFSHLELGSGSGTGASWFDQVYVYGGTPAPPLDSSSPQPIPTYDATNDDKVRLDLNFEDGVVPSFSMKGGTPPVLSVIADPVNSSNKVLQNVIGDGQSYYQTSAPWNNYLVNMKWKFVGWGSNNILSQQYDNFTIYIMTNGAEPNPPAYQVIYRRNKGGVTGFPAGTPYFEVSKHTTTSDVSLGRVAVPAGFVATNWHDFQIQAVSGKVGFSIDGNKLLSVNDGSYSSGGVAFGGINSTVLLDDVKIISNPKFVNYGSNFGLANVTLNGSFNPNYLQYEGTITNTSKPVTLTAPTIVVPGSTVDVKLNGTTLSSLSATPYELPLQNGMNTLIFNENTVFGIKTYAINIFKSLKATSVVWPTEASISATTGTAPVFPATVKVNFEDGSTRDVGLIWDTYDGRLLRQTGQFTLTSRLNLDGRQLVNVNPTKTFTVYVDGILSIDTLPDVNTTEGTAPTLASSVNVNYQYAGTASTPVTVKTLDPSIYANGGIYFAVATVDGAGTILQKVIVQDTLVSIPTMTAITGLTNGTAKTEAALGLPGTVNLATNGGSVAGRVTWNLASANYDPAIKTEQSFTVDGLVSLPSYIDNPNNVALTTSIRVTVSAAAELVSITAPTSVNVANGAAKTSAGLSLPETVSIGTSDGRTLETGVAWNVDAAAYDPSVKAEQTFMVDGVVTLPDNIVNPSQISLTTKIKVTVDLPAPVNIAASATVTASSQFNASYAASNVIDGIIGQWGNGEWSSAGEANPWIKLTWSSNQFINKIVLYDRVNPSDWVKGGTLSFSDNSSVTVSGIPNDGSASEISFPTKKNITWVKFQVTGSTGNNGLSEFQVFNLPSTVVSIEDPAAVTADNGAPKTAEGLGLPSTVIVNTADGENPSANVNWDVDGTSYDPSVNAEQNFTVAGIVDMPLNQRNSNGIPMTASIRVTVGHLRVEGISINDAPSILNIGDTATLRANLLPSNAFNTSIIWTSSDPSIALVDEFGAVTGVAQGTATITVTTVEGGKAAATSISVQDLTPPVLSLPSDITTEATGPDGAVVNFTATATDLVDGRIDVACTSASGSTFAPGETIVTCKTTDKAGNEVRASFKVTVKYGFNGFYSPINMNGTNEIKAGSSVPVIFDLGGNMGLNIFANGAPQVDGKLTNTAGKSELTYDSTTNQYTYVWKTDKTWTGTTKELKIKFIDGTEYVVLFNFK